MTPTLGLVLAGGLSTRMGGGNKGMSPLAGKSLINHVRARLRPQCAALAINANGDDAACFEDLVLPDETAGFPGPLAGIEAGLSWGQRREPRCEWLVSVPADCPFLPDDLVERLHGCQAQTSSSCVFAASGGRDHPTVALWHVSLLEDLRRSLSEDGMRKVSLFLERHQAARAEWGSGTFDPFFNINTPADLLLAEAHIWLMMR